MASDLHSAKAADQRRLAPSPISAPCVAGQRLPVGAGPRTLLLLAAGLVWMAPAWLEPRTLWLMLVWDVLVAAAWLVDLRRLPRPDALVATREWGGPLGLGEPDTVTLRLEARGVTDVEAEIVDTVPVALRSEWPEVRVHAGPAGEGRGVYEVVPTERGDHTVGPLTIRVTSRLALAVRWAICPLEQTVRVYPGLREARKHALHLVRSRQMELERRRARERGHGREMESLRDFREGDEPRDISWTATARRGRLVTREYTPERSQAVWILVDAGRLLRARVGGRTRLDYSVNAALALAQTAMGAGDRVGLLTYGRRPQQRLAPARSAQHLRLMVEALAQTRAEPFEADHATAASVVLSLQKRRALIVWLTEVADTAGVPDVVESSRQMAPRHVVLLAVTRHPALAAAADQRPEQPGDIFRVMAAQETLERRELLLHGLRQRGVSTLEMEPGELSAALVDRYLRVKERSLI